MRLLSKLLIVLFVANLVGCSAAKYVVEPYLKIEFKADETVNPDINGRASPVSVFVFELTSKSLFETQDFFSLYENSEEVLGPELVAVKELSISPEEEYLYNATMSDDVEYIGVIVAFRDIENAIWRKVIPVKQNGYEKKAVIINNLSLVIK